MGGHFNSLIEQSIAVRQSPKVTITSAEIQNLNAVPVEIIPAIPDAHIVIFGWYIHYHFGTVNYTDLGEIYNLYYQDDDVAFSLPLAQNVLGGGFIDQVSNQIARGIGTILLGGGAPSGTEAKALGQAVMIANNQGPGTDASGGDGTMDVVAFYTIGS